MRLDQYLVSHAYTKTRSQASDLIKRGYVEVDGTIIKKTGFEVDCPSIKMIEKATFVSRAGEKLLGALVDFKIDLRDKIMIDIGSSTGGFTDCAIQHGITYVYAYDVGKEQMDHMLRTNPKVELHEETNILDVTLPNSDIITIDVSFTSIIPIMEHLKGYQHEIIALIKPQYEAGPTYFKQGVLKDLKQHKKILFHVLSELTDLGFQIAGLEKSAIKGKMGNQEYVCYLTSHASKRSLDEWIRGVLC